jgi:hypothetical protein
LIQFDGGGVMGGDEPGMTKAYMTSAPITITASANPISKATCLT